MGTSFLRVWRRQRRKNVALAESFRAFALLLLLGGALVSGVLEGLTWGGAAVAVFLVRPLSGWVALLVSKVTETDRWAIVALTITVPSPRTASPRAR